MAEDDHRVPDLHSGPFIPSELSEAIWKAEVMCLPSPSELKKTRRVSRSLYVVCAGKCAVEVLSREQV